MLCTVATRFVSLKQMIHLFFFFHCFAKVKQMIHLAYGKSDEIAPQDYGEFLDLVGAKIKWTSPTCLRFHMYVFLMSNSFVYIRCISILSDSLVLSGEDYLLQRIKSPIIHM